MLGKDKITRMMKWRRRSFLLHLRMCLICLICVYKQNKNVMRVAAQKILNFRRECAWESLIKNVSKFVMNKISQNKFRSDAVSTHPWKCCPVHPIMTLPLTVQLVHRSNRFSSAARLLSFRQC